MKFAAILPNTKLYGGVKRFFELGSVLCNRGHEFYVYTPEGKAPDWYHGVVVTRRLDQLHDMTYDAVFITEFIFSKELLECRSRLKVFYFVRASDSLRPLRKLPGVEVFVNSSNVYEIARRKFGIEAYQAYGGINLSLYHPKEVVEKTGDEPFTIMTYGRLAERKKGTHLVVRACERLKRKGYSVRLLLFDTPVNENALRQIKEFKTSVPFEFVLNHPYERNVELYHRADVFVAAEKNAGISNTAAEAMASGIAVVGTTSGTRDFLIDGVTGVVVSRWSWRIASGIEKLINNYELRKSMALAGRKQIESLSWDSLADTILKHPKLINASP
jgi:glycosyltransferase involved in cell wall biosynthesis